ncbi:MAG: methyltransferase domain-containing protein [Candidatus Aminicenantes bacterium]|nr:methyltransferase domain-containing protein [Candidatus Aminicenantes bacterium]
MPQKGRFIFDSRPGKEAELKRLTLLNEYYRPFMEKLFKSYEKNSREREKPFKKIIDIGAGTGYTTLLLKFFFPYADVTYFDSSLDLTEAAGREITKQGCTVNFLKGDLDSFDFSGTYDLVFSRFTLKHLYDPPAAIKKMTGILDPGGRIVLMDKDVTANIWYPAFPLYRTKYMQALNRYNRQTHRGGDSSVGRKIKYLLSKNNIVNITVEALQTSLTGPENTLYRQLYIGVYENLLPELVEAGFITEDDAHRDITALREFLEDTNNLAITFDFIVSGIKE